MTVERETFLLALSNGPVLQSDALVVLLGEDWEPRIATAAQLYQQGAAPVVVASGGLYEPPRLMDAEHAARKLLGLGVAPDRLIVEPKATNTREQAEQMLELTVLNEWKRLLLVVSAYHLPRAFLTFVCRLDELGLLEAIDVVPMPAVAPWFRPPTGMRISRRRLWELERGKIDRYECHVASYERGSEYLRYWEKNR